MPSRSKVSTYKFLFPVLKKIDPSTEDDHFMVVGRYFFPLLAPGFGILLILVAFLNWKKVFV